MFPFYLLFKTLMENQLAVFQVNMFINNLKGLYMDSCPFLDLKQFTDIEDLWIGHEENISELKDFKKLRSLTISADSDLSILEHIESLDGLDIYYYSPTYDYDEYSYQDIKIKLTLPENSKITTITLEDIVVTDENVNKFLNLKDLEYLYFLRCDFSSINEESYYNLKALKNRISIDYISCTFEYEMDLTVDSITTMIEYPTDYEIDDTEPTEYYTEYVEPTEYYTEYAVPTEYYTEYAVPTEYYTEYVEPTDY